MTAPVPGYDLRELLGFGATGEVWLARELVSGDAVAIKRLRVGAGLQARDRLRREAAVLAAIEHPHLLRLRRVVSLADELVLVLDHAAGGSLGALVTARGALVPGEVVTVAAPLASALEVVHRRSVVHGDVSPGNVLFSGDGRPLLSDLGVARLLGEPLGEPEATADFVDPAVLLGSPSTPASDVWALGAVCAAALAGTTTAPPGGWAEALQERAVAEPVLRPLVRALTRALAADPSDRPTAGELASDLFAACAAVPVGLVPVVGAAGRPPLAAGEPVTHRVRRPAPPTSDVPAAPGRRRAPPPAPRTVAGQPARVLLAVAAGVVALLGGAVGIGIAWAGAGGSAAAGAAVGTGPVTGAAAPAAPATAASVPPAAGSAASDTAAAEPESTSWVAVLDELDAVRSRAFAQGRVDLLAEVYAEGSPAGRRDVRALQGLMGQGLRATGARLSVTSARPLEAGLAVDFAEVAPTLPEGSRVRLRVVDRMAPYRLETEDREVTSRRPGRGSARWTVTLASSGGGWRVWDVSTAA